MAAKTITTADENISTVVRMVIAARRLTVGDVARALTIDPATVHGKMNGKRGWKADEVQVLADYFGLPVATFYAGSAGLLPSCDNETSDQQMLFDLPIAS